ncbi:CBS domain-containing protein [Sporolactobacillus kofuensis]|uniref:CBS domain-containing protein n=1 Tax=Sporolactobacillus kofuensis TaxID=269672 RepID=A0ABW1WH55_9BACL|nr:CBS domain-containing protein [Sporolactobacillus kofuensis]MCO7176103.1 CBS domain-containing protein [Sporolactobacillus kofuensis]
MYEGRLIHLAQKISDVMSKDVICCSPEQSVKDVAELMSTHNIGSIPVTDNGRFEGIITDRDITLRSTAKGKDSDQMTVFDCMSSHTLTSGTPDMDVQEAARLMADHQIRRLPIVENGRVIGIVSLGDLATESQYDHEAEKALSGISAQGVH